MRVIPVLTSAILGLSLAVVLGSVAGCGPSGKKAPAPRVFENPMIDVEVGEWAAYKLSDKNTFRIEVVKVVPGAGPVTITERSWSGDVGSPMAGAAERTLGRNHMMNGYQSAGWIVRRIHEDTVTVAGRRWNALCFEYLTMRHGPVKVWYSQDVPVYGMLKQVRVSPAGQETVNAELVDWSGRQETK